MGVAPTVHLPSLVLIAVALVVGSCTAGPDTPVETPPRAAAPSPLPATPRILEGGLADDLRAELDEFVSDPVFFARGRAETIAGFGDVRAAWVLLDALRFQRSGQVHDELVDALTSLTGVEVEGDPRADWVVFSDALLRWDVPAPPGYLDLKRAAYLGTEPDWAPFFDPAADLDWRQVAWGGVLRGAIEPLDHPDVVPAVRATDLTDDDVVFGVVVGGQARAYPRRYLEVHELVNDTVGDQPIVLPYCTLCGTALAFEPVADGERLLFGTSGLLLRSNKLMHDEATESLWHQFEGTAVSGPLRGTRLQAIDLTVTDWLAWRSTHPDTTVVARPSDDARYDGSFLGDRDGTPIFPVGDVDPRLAPETVVVGVVSPEGQAVAFPRQQASAILEAGGSITAAGVELRRAGPGFEARPAGGGPSLRVVEAFWFAWSQFRPATDLWLP